jgi:hypothetical protein
VLDGHNPVRPKTANSNDGLLGPVSQPIRRPGTAHGRTGARCAPSAHRAEGVVTPARWRGRYRLTGGQVVAGSVERGRMIQSGPAATPNPKGNAREGGSLREGGYSPAFGGCAWRTVVSRRSTAGAGYTRGQREVETKAEGRGRSSVALTGKGRRRRRNLHSRVVVAAVSSLESWTQSGATVKRC